MDVDEAAEEDRGGVAGWRVLVPTGYVGEREEDGGGGGFCVPFRFVFAYCGCVTVCERGDDLCEGSSGFRVRGGEKGALVEVVAVAAVKCSMPGIG